MLNNKKNQEIEYNLIQVFAENILNNLTGKSVVVTASGITYSGKLIEIGETEIYLLAESGWIVIPVGRITSLKEAQSSS